VLLCWGGLRRLLAVKRNGGRQRGGVYQGGRKRAQGRCVRGGRVRVRRAVEAEVAAKGAGRKGEGGGCRCKHSKRIEAPNREPRRASKFRRSSVQVQRTL